VLAAQTSSDLAGAYADQADWDPRQESEPYVYLLLRPTRVQTWRESNELDGRLLMRDGVWLAVSPPGRPARGGSAC
jgi:hypothetical protein